jgi:protein phosphatase
MRPVQGGDVFVLCSDGLTDPLDDEEIGSLCGKTAPEDLAEALVQAALDGGADDNVTVVVAHVAAA